MATRTAFPLLLLLAASPAGSPRAARQEPAISSRCWGFRRPRLQTPESAAVVRIKSEGSPYLFCGLWGPGPGPAVLPTAARPEEPVFPLRSHPFRARKSTQHGLYSFPVWLHFVLFLRSDPSQGSWHLCAIHPSVGNLIEVACLCRGRLRLQAPGWLGRLGRYW